MILAGIPYFLVVAAFRLMLVIIGWFIVPLTLLADGAKRTPRLYRMWADAEHTPAAYATSRWKKYVWWAWRNPTPGLKGKFKQPIPEVHPNPDKTVRSGQKRSDSRWLQSGIYWEYWYLRKAGSKFFEFRIGWKFVDGNDEFFPTLQIGPKR